MTEPKKKPQKNQQKAPLSKKETFKESSAQINDIFSQLKSSKGIKKEKEKTNPIKNKSSEPKSKES